MVNINPFETINLRLSNIEELLLELKINPIEEKKSENLTVRETSEILKVSTQSIINYIKKGFLPAKKVGRIYLIKRIDLDSAMIEAKSLKYKRN